MTEQETVSKEDIEQMSYTDFIGFINQWNVPPGAYSTLSEWRVFSNINKNSTVLEIACTSGFSVRELTRATQAAGTGIDLSAASIEAAKLNQNMRGGDKAVNYIAGDANQFLPEQKFTHVIIGAALKFFPEPEKTMSRIMSGFLVDGGMVLACPFYVPNPIPQSLIEKARNVFGITVTNEPYKDVMRFYKGLDVMYERHPELRQETVEELKHYCESTVTRACKARQISNAGIQQAMFDRLMTIKSMSNELRPYQRYVVLVLRYNADTYPNRFVELF